MKKEKHLKHNADLEKLIERVQDKNGHINGQARFPVGEMNFGHVRAGFASCEAIAVFNVLKEAGIDIPLSRIFFDVESLGFLFAGGVFGTKISKIGKFLKHYGVNSQKMKVRDFVSHGKAKQFKDDEVFIVTIKTNRKLPISPLHTFEMSFEDGNWTVYNRFNSDNHPSIYSELDDILINGEKKGAFYSVYKVLI